MATKKLTETSVARMNTLSLHDTEIRGFAIRQRKTGKYFCFEYKSPSTGANRKIGIGKHGTITVEQARSVAKKLAGEIALGCDPLAKKQEKEKLHKRQKQASLQAFLEGGFKDVTPEKNYKFTAGQIRKHFQFLLDIPMADITPWEIEKWKQAYPGKPSSANRTLCCLRAVLTKAVKADLLESSPMPLVKNLREDKNKKIRYLTKDEEKQLISALNQREQKMKKERNSYIQWCKCRSKDPPEPYSGTFTDHLKPMVMLALHTGLRQGEVFNLRVTDIDFSVPLLTVCGSGTKSGQTRQIPLNQTVKSVLEHWLDQTNGSTLVFPSPVTGLRFDNIKKAWQQVRKLSGLHNIRFHDLRHTFGTRLSDETEEEGSNDPTEDDEDAA